MTAELRRLLLAASVVLGASVGLGLHAGASRSPAHLTRVGFDDGTSLERMPPPPAANAPAAHVGNHGGTVIVDAHGLLVAERSAGALVRADDQGRRVAALTLSPGLGELVHDGAGAVFVADRGADRVARVAPGDAEGVGLELAASTEIREPHGLALTPDGARLLVTSIADHELIALDAATLEPVWRVELAPEPRGVAVSPDGALAAVGFLSSSSIALVDLPSWGQRVSWRSLDPRDRVIIDRVRDTPYGGGSKYVNPDAPADELAPLVDAVFIGEARSRFRVPVEAGRRYARNAYGLAFLGGDALVVAHQLATPQLQRVPRLRRGDVYGGGIERARPLSHRLSFASALDSPSAALRQISVDLRQPRALAYDAEHDRLFVAGYGDERIIALADAATQMPWVEWMVELDAPCGIDGLALGRDARPLVWVHCEFRRQLRGLEVPSSGGADNIDDPTWLLGDELATSARDEQVERGAELFRRADERISSAALLACSSCHPEGRSDGLSWRLGPSVLQAPILAGRVGDTGPYKWDGQDPDLRASLRHTIERLGGRPEDIGDDELDAIIAYIESLPPPRPRTMQDPEAVARGRATFEAAGCDGCHAGPKLSDRQQHELDTSLEHVDTPSLLGLGHSAPYFHDGSAIDLWALLTDRGSVHEMADTSGLSDAQLRDLVAYLESL